MNFILPIANNSINCHLAILDVCLFKNNVCFICHWLAISACNFYEQLRREAAVLKIQKNFRCYTARISYKALQNSAIIVQTGMRAMTARGEHRFRKQTKAAIKIQVMISLSYCKKSNRRFMQLEIVTIDTSFCCSYAGSCTWSQRIFVLQKSPKGCYCYTMWLEAARCSERAPKASNGSDQSFLSIFILRVRFLLAHCMTFCLWTGF